MKVQLSEDQETSFVEISYYSVSNCYHIHSKFLKNGPSEIMKLLSKTEQVPYSLNISREKTFTDL